jgi:hypothetical protein
LAASLKQETDEKERVGSNFYNTSFASLIVSSFLYSSRITSLTSALSGAESRLNEFYGEQSRWEMELAQRLDITEKLREQVRELEKEKRDLQRRYNEQVRSKTFRVEYFFDNVAFLDRNIRSRKASILR